MRCGVVVAVVIVASGVLSLVPVACNSYGPEEAATEPAQPFQTWTCQHAIDTFTSAGLEVDDPQIVVPEEYPDLSRVDEVIEIMQFGTPSLSYSSQYPPVTYIISYGTQEALEEEMGTLTDLIDELKETAKGLPDFQSPFSVFAKDNIMVFQVFVRENESQPYQQALGGLTGEHGTFDLTPSPTVAPTLERLIDLEVTSYSSYVVSGQAQFYGEAINRSDVPLQAVRIVLSLRDAEGGILAVDEDTRRVDFVPVGGKYPFRILIRVDELQWHDVEFLFQAKPVDGSSFRGLLPLSLETEGVSGRELGFYPTYALAGRVVNTGDKPVEDVRLVGIIYDSHGQVVEVAGGRAALDQIPAGGYSPFELDFHHVSGEPYDYDIMVEGKEVE